MSWSDVKPTSGDNNSSSGGINYIKLENGTTQLRIVGDQPYSRWTHWIPQANENRGLSVDCIGKECPVCKQIADDKKNKRKSKYGSRKVHSICAIVRKPNADPEMGLLEQGNKIFNGLLVLLEQMGDLRNYDVKIVKTGTDFSSIDYSVLPTFPPVPMTDAEKALPLYTVDQIKKSFTKEQIEMLMNGAKLDEVVGTNANEVPENPIEDTTTEAPGVDFTQRV